MLQPKKTKFRRCQKGRIKGFAHRGQELAFGSFGIKSMGTVWLTGRQIEAARIAVTRYMQRQGQVWIRVFPDKPITKKPLDVHYMIVHPENYIQRTAKLGAMMMNVHAEACTHLHRTIQEIHQAGMKAGVTLNPATPVYVLENVIKDVDMVLLMSVNPGFGGQVFIENTIQKVKQLRKLIDESGSKALIEIDGGVQGDTAPRLVKAGADILVSGSYVFKSATPEQTIHELRSL